MYFPNRYLFSCSVLLVFILLIPISAWAQDPQQPIRWNDVLDQEPAWYASDEAVRIADNVLAYQDVSGGWPKNIDMARMISKEERERIRQAQADRGPVPNNITIDNSATHTQMRFLARVYNQTNHTRFKERFLQGLDYLLKAQYENGGWPQYYPLREGYYSEITFNDGAMVGVLYILKDITDNEPNFAFVEASHRTASQTALDKGIENILRTQIRQNGVLTAWCAQHDKNTLEPTWARAYEPPSLSGGESVGIVRFLMSIEDPSPEIIAAIEGAVTWLNSVTIHGYRLERFRDAEGEEDRRIVPDPDAPPLWARFYELGTNRPIFLGRNSVTRYALADIEQERRGGYAYYGTWATELLNEEYPKWQLKYASSSR